MMNSMRGCITYGPLKQRVFGFIGNPNALTYYTRGQRTQHASCITTVIANAINVEPNNLMLIK